jgi:hypothetical protein
VIGVLGGGKKDCDFDCDFELDGRVNLFLLSEYFFSALAGLVV